MSRLHLVPLVTFVIAGHVGNLGAQTTVNAPTGPEVRTSGMGDVALSPDRAVLRIGVETEDSTAALAAERNRTQFSRVLDVLQSLGIPSDSLQRLSYTVRPNYDWERGRRTTGYSARVVIRLTLRDLDRLAPVIDGVLAAGATDIPNVAFESNAADEARLEALAEALSRARSDAEALAAAHGGQLGRLLEVSTSARGYDYALEFDAGYAAAVGPMELAPREVHIRVNVYARWELLP